MGGNISIFYLWLSEKDKMKKIFNNIFLCNPLVTHDNLFKYNNLITYFKSYISSLFVSNYTINNDYNQESTYKIKKNIIIKNIFEKNNNLNILNDNNNIDYTIVNSKYIEPLYNTNIIYIKNMINTILNSHITIDIPIRLIISKEPNFNSTKVKKFFSSFCSNLSYNEYDDDSDLLLNENDDIIKFLFNE